MTRDVVMAILLAIRMIVALVLLAVPFFTPHGFSWMGVILFVIGAALLLSVIHAVLRIRGWSRREPKAG
jgi:hypothetical protein